MLLDRPSTLWSSNMKKSNVSTSLAFAQEERNYTEGQVVEVRFVRTEPGKFDDYMRYLHKTYKPLLDEAKKARIVVDWAVFSARPHEPQGADLVLTITYKNMAALDDLQTRFDPLAVKAFGSLAKTDQAEADREKLRKDLGTELIRQLILK
jgi:hypothetical protein